MHCFYCTIFIFKKINLIDLQKMSLFQMYIARSKSVGTKAKHGLLEYLYVDQGEVRENVLHDQRYQVCQTCHENNANTFHVLSGKNTFFLT